MISNHQVLQFSLTSSPIISCTSTFFCYKEVFRIVQVGVFSILNIVNDTWFQINKKSPRDVMFIICLVEEHIFSVLVLSCERLQYSIRGDTMLGTKLFPEFITNYRYQKMFYRQRYDETYSDYRTIQPTA